MISILDIDHQHSLELADSLKLITQDYKITSSESELMKSSKIIISFSGNISRAIRKIHMLNLFSALRMISDKPVLGINSGMHLLCENVGNLSCLGLISGLIVKTDDLSENKIIGNKSEIVKLKDDLLLKDINDNAEFYFEQCHLLQRNIYSTSVMKNNQDLSTSIKKNNYFGVQFLPQKSGENGLKILSNFIEM